ncbi:MAG: tetratricopeptide repeat protein, partial [Planctomycetota bacterium]|nr:tetratricopeptide repeat protein [Planctomycetota bacterium]
DQYVYSNPMLQSPDGLYSIWTDPSKSPQYYPITFTVLWVQYQLFEDAPAGYHALNVLLHVINSLLCFVVLKQLRLSAAFWIAMAFALHPIQVETVAWVTELKNLLSGMFYGLAWLTIWPALAPKWSRSKRLPEENEEQARPAILLTIFQFGLGTLLFACALYSKSITASLPAALAVALWFAQGNIRRSQTAILIPLLLLGAFAGWQTASMELEHVGAIGDDWNYGFVERVGIASRCVVHYIQQCSVPFEQMFFYPRYEPKINATALFAILACFTIAFSLTIYTWNQRKRGAISSVAFFVGSALPALGFLNVYPHRFSFVADHFVYLPVVGVFCFVWSILLDGAKFVCRDFKVQPPLCLLAFVALLCVYCFQTMRYTPVFESEKTLWTDTINKNPSSVAALQNLALVYVRENDPDGALFYLEKAEEYKFDRFQTLNSKGLVLGMQGRVISAKQAFMESITEDPTNPTPWVNLGNLSRNAPNSGAGLMSPKQYYEKSWQVKPNYLAAFALGESAFKADDFLIAADWYQKAVSERPWDIDALYNRALSLLSAGQVDEARAACEELLEQYPNDRETKKLLRKCRP